MNRGYGAVTAALQPRAGTRLTALALLVAMLLALFALPAAAAAGGRTVLVMGDSLSAAYGLAPEQGWVSLVAAKMRKAAPGWTVVNASVSGETTDGGASRIAGALAKHRPAVVVIELGANDGLRGLDLDRTLGNLEKMIVASKKAGADVLLVGMRLPPNYGRRYTDAFAANFRELAEAHGTALLPFLLEPIATDRDAFLPDNLHPDAEAQPAIRDHVWTALAPLLK
jgi:acyl-CoA thioesterase-1